MSVDDLFDLLSSDPDMAAHVRRIRQQKIDGTRRTPAETVLLAGEPLGSPDVRARLLDKVAELVDENQTGRSDMCVPFAALMAKALVWMGHPARAMVGRVAYQYGSGEYEWDHAWVEFDDQVIDGNVDSMAENPMVPQALQLAPPRPFWGPSADVPADRSIRSSAPFGGADGNEQDIEMWWHDLQQWLEAEGLHPNRTTLPPDLSGNS